MAGEYHYDATTMTPHVIRSLYFSGQTDQVLRFFLYIKELRRFSPPTRSRPGGDQVWPG